MFLPDVYDNEVYRVPRQFNTKLEVIENALVVTAGIANQMNQDYRHSCEVHDVIDIESQKAADKVYAEA